MRSLLPKTLTGQTVLVLLIGLSISHLISMALYSSDRAEALSRLGGRDTAQHLANIVRVVNSAPMPWRNYAVDSLNQDGFKVWISDESPLPHDLSPPADIQALREFLMGQLNAEQTPPIHVRVQSDETHLHDGGLWTTAVHWFQGIVGGHILRVSLRLGAPNANGQWLNFEIDIPQSNPLWSGMSLLSMLAMGAAVVLLSMWAVHRLTVPLRTFARAATRLGKDVGAPPLDEGGPMEISDAAVAFNHMQEQLKRMVENRTQMLAAISHDLRTPVTLLKLRTDQIADDDERAKMLATLDDMEHMIASTMEFARQDAENEERRKVDLSALLASICDDLSDAGFKVSFEDVDKCPYECRPLSLRRALTNLIDNALKFGGGAHVSLTQTPQNILIAIEDDGPGIDDSMMDDVFQPFFRCDSSRNPETGGTGLGLSVVQSVAHAHGGEVTLTNRPQGGLRAELRLPR